MNKSKLKELEYWRDTEEKPKCITDLESKSKEKVPCMYV